MIAGHEELIKNFKKLAKEQSLSHGYIFFGEPQVGKHLFAKSLANFLEGGEFKAPDSYFKETLEIEPDPSGSIGIDAIRDLKYFLSEKPVNSPKRIVIIDEAERLTLQAQNAILKISEEPPSSALIILIVSNPEALISTLQSRFVKVYFSRVNSSLIEKFLISELKLKKSEVERIVPNSFGRPGRAIAIVENAALKELRKEVEHFLKERVTRKNYLRNLAETEEVNLFLQELMATLSLDIKKNWPALKNISECLLKISEWNTNKRLQLEAHLWNI